jgi:hypothetical protein
LGLITLQETVNIIYIKKKRQAIFNGDSSCKHRFLFQRPLRHLFRVSITRTRRINFKKGMRTPYGREGHLPESIKMEMRMLVCTVTRSRR